MGRRADVDWGRIQSLYEAGDISIREIARQEGVQASTITRKIGKMGWDLNPMALLNRDRKFLKVRLPMKDKPKPVDEMEKAGFIYVIYIDSGAERFYKIGLAKRFDARFEQHQCSSPFDVCVALAYFVGNMRQEERDLHLKYRLQRIRGEWFRLTRSDLADIAKRSLLVRHE